ncbi:MAG: DUF3160 domain-containing protein [Acetatifactor sp.]|nr:DUF3160 domain-containing protein [Acetatifactor sp.]
MKRKGKSLSMLLAAVMAVMAIMTACAAPGQSAGGGEGSSSGQGRDTPIDISEEQSVEVPNSPEMPDTFAASPRPSLVGNVETGEESSLVPCVEPYTIMPDLSNVDNLWQFYLADGMADKLARNGFVVCGGAGGEFFEVYEENRYMLLPSFVTVDSMMHTYHLYFSHLLKNVEKEFLMDSLMQLGGQMLKDSASQYEQLRGTEWESAARRNLAFFTVGAKLLDDDVAIEEDVEEIVRYELDNISHADGIYTSRITDGYEDYTQYIPRGYYEGDRNLERYFLAMMWYGRIHFSQENEDLDRSALLISVALAGDPEAYDLWESIYAVTSFFAGASDDLGVCEYVPVICEAYGDHATLEDLVGNQEAFERFHGMTASLSAPQINSIPIEDGDENVIRGFRFMGQRFTIDAAIMQKLVYQKVGANSAGDKRMLPSVLDVPAALGSDTALTILTESGAMDYEGYGENMNRLREGLGQEDTTLWTASLYANWLNTLRPLLEVKGEGYPMFMQSEEWRKKDLECFAGSFTELKHDTILYSKQVIAEMGGDYGEEPDYRGYVEPEPLIYARFARLADLTAQGLEKYGMLSSDDQENLSRLSQMADQLMVISQKELREENLTEEEFEFIECYGGYIEHFWYDAVKGESEYEGIASEEFPAAVVVDIATDPNGAVLEAATGNPSLIYVVVKVDGKLKIAKGSVYDFYQFAWPLEDRLTDSKWRQMMGLQADEEDNYHFEKVVSKPGWTDSYRYRYEWDYTD